jgi:hypothetical protein
VQTEVQLASFIPLAGIALCLPLPPVPDHHGPSPVLTLGDDTFEGTILKRVILHVDGQRLHSGIHARPLGNRPAPERAVEFEAEIEVEVSSGVLLDHEGSPGLLIGPGPAPWLRSAAEVPLPAVVCQ